MAEMSDGALARRLPEGDAAPDRLVRVWPEGKVPLGAYDVVASRSRAYRGLAGAESGRDVSLTGGGAPARDGGNRLLSNHVDTISRTRNCDPRTLTLEP